MLEQSLLMLNSWMRQATPAGDYAWVRPIANAHGLGLGFVQFLGTPRTSWFTWLQPTRLEVYETEDASHLMTLSRSWGILGSWRIDDAEERHVGNVYAATIVTSDHARLGYLETNADGQGRLLDPLSRALANFVRRDGITEVSFLPDLSANPFVRMLVLGSILTLDPMPVLN
jgi:hypothetical protein